MAVLKWDQSGSKFYETGVDRCVLYKQNESGIYPKGVAWSGITAINKSPSGAEPTPLYADNVKYLELTSVEELGLGIEAYTYPDEFAECDGSAELIPGVQIEQQDRKSFGLAYRTKIGNDVKGNDLGYKLHLVYGCKAAPTEKGYSTINDSPEAMTLSWEVTTTPVDVEGFKPTASLEIDSRKVESTKLKKLEDILYGTSETEPRLPLPEEIKSIFSSELHTMRKEENKH